MTEARDTGQLSMCAGKVAFDSQALAARVATRHRKTDRNGMQPYRCVHCPGWHVGAVKRAPRRARSNNNIEEQQAWQHSV